MAKQHQNDKQENDDLRTEQPISEKDEVKQAEERTAKHTKKTDDSVAADLKNRENK